VGAIQTLADVIRETADRFLNDVSDRFRGSVRAIYRVSTDRELPEHLGTCTLLEHGAERVLITAAHVSDHSTQTSLYVGGANSLVEIKDPFFATQAPDGNRDKDFFDFAVCRPRSETLEELGDVTFMPSALCADRSFPPGANHLYGCLGFPNSKNRGIHAGNRSVKTVLWRYSSYAVAPPALEGYPSTDQHHLFVDFDGKRAKTADGQVVNAIWPQGASGGPIFDMGDFGDKAIAFPDAVCQPRLAAILIQKPAKAKVLMGVRIQAVLAALADRPAWRSHL